MSSVSKKIQIFLLFIDSTLSLVYSGPLVVKINQSINGTQCSFLSRKQNNQEVNLLRGDYKTNHNQRFTLVLKHNVHTYT